MITLWSYLKILVNNPVIISSEVAKYHRIHLIPSLLPIKREVVCHNCQAIYKDGKIQHNKNCPITIMKENILRMNQGSLSDESI
jgi:hypothetical protein